ncbi:MAG: hypothetical protein JRJ12_11240 [Deltaproteobacteria bacterium]|nr:hypothetical protein [Deltaproteobacteria bacterium]MBW2073113.1 hypothetical protein [Deltaproteobacteria bacterium]
MAVALQRYRGSQIYCLVYCRLLEAARKKEGVWYEELRQMMALEPGADSAREIGRLLGEINEEEHSNGRPLLSAVAVDPTTRMPGEGFFRYARQVNKFAGETEEDKRQFWRDEIQKVYEVW